MSLSVSLCQAAVSELMKGDLTPFKLPKETEQQQEEDEPPIACELFPLPFTLNSYRQVWASSCPTLEKSTVLVLSEWSLRSRANQITPFPCFLLKHDVDWLDKSTSWSKLPCFPVPGRTVHEHQRFLSTYTRWTR